MRVHLPHCAWLGNIDPFVRSLDLSSPERLVITSNPHWTYVHPVVLSMVAALGKTVRPENITHTIQSKSAHYFERMGLFRLWGIESGMRITQHEEPGRFIPLTMIRTERELSRLIEDIIPIFHLSDYPEQADTMRYVVDELARNVIEHAGVDATAFVCVQYYDRSKKVRIGIADTGLGLRATLRRHHHVELHLDAIQKALWPGITGTTSDPSGSEQNAGAGLFFTKSLARVNKDHFFLYSGDAMFKLLEPKEENRLRIPIDPFDDRHTKAEGLPCWRGTVVGIDITLQQTMHFQALLASLNSVLKEAVRERRKILRARKPRFV